MNPVKAIIFDLDGTAIPSAIDGMPSKRLCETIERYADKLFFCAATGRSWQHAKRPITALNLTRPCIISGGTQIIDPQAETIMWQVTIAQSELRSILDVAQIHGKQVALVIGLTVTDPIDPNVDVTNVNTVYMFNLSAQEYREIGRQLNELEYVSASPTRSWRHPDVIDVHITHRQATKEYAVAKLLQLLSVPKQQSIGVGDGHNDLHLFNAVGYKVAMGNAEAELKVQADMVIDDLSHDGLACFIENDMKAIA